MIFVKEVVTFCHLLKFLSTHKWRHLTDFFLSRNDENSQVQECVTVTISAAIKFATQPFTTIHRETLKEDKQKAALRNVLFIQKYFNFIMLSSLSRRRPAIIKKLHHIDIRPLSRRRRLSTTVHAFTAPIDDDFLFIILEIINKRLPLLAPIEWRSNVI
jgi:hypothetical protein